MMYLQKKKFLHYVILTKILDLIVIFAIAPKE